MRSDVTSAFIARNGWAMNPTITNEDQKQDHIAPEASPTATDGTRPTPEDPPITTGGHRHDAESLAVINGGGTSGNHGNGTAG